MDTFQMISQLDRAVKLAAGTGGELSQVRILAAGQIAIVAKDGTVFHYKWVATD